ncbi:MAG: DUF4062 domain-containing protein [Desulfobaccales bacterium]
MAIPRVFVSSTCYDLKYIRENLKYFIKRLGYDPVLSEEGSIFFNPSLHTHDACIAEVPNCQMFVLIIGGRFGSQFKGEVHSITNAEYREAVRLKTPIFAIVEQTVYNDSHVYSHNLANESIDASSIIYPSVDNISIFNFIDEVKANAVNNAIVPFRDFADIETYLTQQWAGMMYAFLTRDNENARMTDTLEMMKEMNERIEILSRQILRSVGTTEAKITAELYDTMIPYSNIRILSFENIGLNLKKILENTTIEEYISASGFKYFIDSNILTVTGDRYSMQSKYRLTAEIYQKLRNELIGILDKHGITIERYLEMS